MDPQITKVFFETNTSDMTGWPTHLVSGTKKSDPTTGSTLTNFGKKFQTVAKWFPQIDEKDLLNQNKDKSKDELNEMKDKIKKNRIRQ